MPIMGRSWWTALPGRAAGSRSCCPAAQWPQAAQRNQPAKDTSLPRVLIVEDEPDMQLGLRDTCEYEGYEVLVASDGEAGIQQTLKNRPDIILLDVMLPKLSGLDVCRHLRKQGIKTPIIMLTASRPGDGQGHRTRSGSRRLRHQAFRRKRACGPGSRTSASLRNFGNAGRIQF